MQKINKDNFTVSMIMDVIKKYKIKDFSSSNLYVKYRENSIQENQNTKVYTRKINYVIL